MNSRFYIIRDILSFNLNQIPLPVQLFRIKNQQFSRYSIFKITNKERVALGFVTAWARNEQYLCDVASQPVIDSTVPTLEELE